MRPRRKFRAIAAVLGACGALVITGCGGDGDSEGEIGSQDADAMIALIDEVESAVDAGECTDAQAAAGQLEVEVVNLTNVSGETSNALAGATESLQSLISQECGQDERSTSSTTSTKETTDTSTSTTTTTPETTTTTTTEEEPTTTEETSTTTQTTTQTDEGDDDTGGIPGTPGGVGTPQGGAGGTD